MKESISHFELLSKPIKCRLCPGEQEWKLQNNIITTKMLQNNLSKGHKEEQYFLLDGDDVGRDRNLHLFWEFLKTFSPDGDSTL